MSNRVIVVRGTGPMWNPSWFTAKRCAEIQARNAIAYQTDVLGEFADPETGWLSPVSVAKYTRETPFEWPYQPGSSYCAALDTSGGSATGNPWCLVIVRTMRVVDREAPSGSADGFRVCAVREWRGLDPQAIWNEVADALERYRLKSVHIDQYAGAQNVSLARLAGVQALETPWTGGNKVQAFSDVATLVHSDRIDLSPDRQFQRDILSVKKRVKANGFEIVLPKTSDGRHADYAPAFVMAVSNAVASYGWEAYREFSQRQRERELAKPPTIREQLGGDTWRTRQGRILDQSPEQRAASTFPYDIPRERRRRRGPGIGF
ncbi:MAG TPA: hypothetical protein VKP30_30645 [Polyangiaceae bacterium]|nr:hypothetical protein [Polyangiaceae bacterium]